MLAIENEELPLKHYRKRMGITLRKVAETAGMSYSHLSNIESNKQKLTDKAYIRLVVAYTSLKVKIKPNRALGKQQKIMGVMNGSTTVRSTGRGELQASCGDKGSKRPTKKPAVGTDKKGPGYPKRPNRKPSH